MDKNARYLLSLLVSMFISTNTYSQIKVYKLVDETHHADIDRKKFDQLNKLRSGYHLLNKAFKPTKGKYTVYRFIATYKGLSHETEKTETFHDLVILKTDRLGSILAAYQYTLEWAEMPFTYDLFKSASNGLKLRDRLQIAAFKFQRTEPVQKGSTYQFLVDNGYLSLVDSKR